MTESSQRILKPVAVVLGLVLLAGAGSQITLEQAEATIEWIRSAGAVGALVYSVIYALGTVTAMPASWLQGGAGFLYGPFYGPLFAWLVGTGIGVLNFVLGRTLLRSWVEARMANHPRFQAIDSRIGQDGIWLVALLRLPPLSPHNPLSYALGLTQIRTRDYILGTLLGSLPAVAIWANVGASLEAIGALIDGSASSSQSYVSLVGLSLTLAATVAVTLYARKALNEALVTEEA